MTLKTIKVGPLFMCAHNSPTYSITQTNTQTHKHAYMHVYEKRDAERDRWENLSER